MAYHFPMYDDALTELLDLDLPEEAPGPPGTGLVHGGLVPLHHHHHDMYHLHHLPPPRVRTQFVFL